MSAKGLLVSSLGLIKEYHPDNLVYSPLVKKFRFLDGEGFFENKKRKLHNKN